MSAHRRGWRFLSIIILACSAGPAPAQPAMPAGGDAAPIRSLTGKLFFTPEQRERLDTARQRGIVPVGEFETVPPPPIINGVVRHQGGAATVWIDGKVYRLGAGAKLPRSALIGEPPKVHFQAARP